jgi:predicted RNA-binding Zn-ribbon protein involved in translation (DUF1610 family)
MFRKAGRAVFHFTAVMSALLLLASLVLWPVSYQLDATIKFHHFQAASFQIRSMNGTVSFIWVSLQSSNPFTGFRIKYRHPHARLNLAHNADYRVLDFGLSKGGGFSASGVRTTYFVVPWWFLTALLAILPILWLWRSRSCRKLTAETSMCPSCGYDLRGSIPAGATYCPECGTAIPAMISTGTKSVAK